MGTYPKPVEDIAFAHRERPIRIVDASARYASLMRALHNPPTGFKCREGCVGPYEKAQIACPRLAVRCAAYDCRGPRSPPKHENEKSSFGAGRGNHWPELSGADIGLNLLNHMDAAASWRKIPCHLPVPFVHSLEMKPRRERHLVFVGEPGDGVFDRVDSHATAIMAQGTKAIHLA
jgi:hypothetical protein